ncbi:MAG: Rrf2 family transcriptional regulator [Spirochaetes bacterium]|nr:Rrf2 family transcriptional regulator [Spirochaetota bacterium]
MQLFTQIGDLGPSWFHIALRTLVLLSHSESLLKSKIIADILGTDPTFVRKILKRLEKDEIVKAHGGRYGGYSISKKPEDITVGDVYRSLTKGGSVNIFSVKQTGTEAFISMIITKAENKFKSILDEYTISDIKKYISPAIPSSYIDSK